jgi:hypothetical protein
MAKIATRGIIWQGPPERDAQDRIILDEISGEPMLLRVEVMEGKPVPLTVPSEILGEWEEQGLVVDNPDVEAPEEQEGPPIGMVPIPRKPGEPPYQQVRSRSE